MRRFHSKDINTESGVVRLDPEQSAHARSVLRLSKGDRAGVFDGNGNEFVCEIEEVGKREALLRIISPADPPAPESPLDLILAASLLKHDKFDLVIQKAVELGVTRLVPVLSKRTEVQARKGGSRLVRWKKVIVETSKQCGRAKLMEIGTPSGISDISGVAADLKIVFAERGGEGIPDAGNPRSVIALVGPEGGWEDEELRELTDSRFHAVTLGRRILRAETASIAAASILQHRFGDLEPRPEG
ncbi:MAG TPA: 16S rRNA (uracil(1498)-N(3))-methyltransferase [Aridibacter sp.]|nr:16S rRNA (uracil(1498)-N(3))-methyltransferase [Aridibacter sp.]